MSTVTVQITLPTTRAGVADANAPSDIASVTILRDIGDGNGPQTLTVVQGPFTTPTVSFTDASPATGSDAYSAFVIDTQVPPVQGATSAPASATITPVLAPFDAPTVTVTVNP
jgi:hypothetical protein